MNASSPLSEIRVALTNPNSVLASGPTRILLVTFLVASNADLEPRELVASLSGTCASAKYLLGWLFWEDLQLFHDLYTPTVSDYQILGHRDP